MVRLIIVESHAKCNKFEEFLGIGYKCVASFGHIRQLSQIRDGFTPVFTLLPGKTKYIRNLKTQVKKAEEVILATDDDREGEAIAWHLCIYLNLPVMSTKRIIFHEITKLPPVVSPSGYHNKASHLLKHKPSMHSHSTST